MPRTYSQLTSDQRRHRIDSLQTAAGKLERAADCVRRWMRKAEHEHLEIGLDAIYQEIRRAQEDLLSLLGLLVIDRNNSLLKARLNADGEQ